MLKINFRSKEISKLEAKILLSKLKSGLISLKLNEQEQKVYKSWKKAIEYFNSLSKKPNKINLSEKEYLIGELNSKIQIAGLGEKIKYCKKQGHVPKSEHISSGQSGTRVYGECKRCGMNYYRHLNSKEWENFHKMMNRPMTI